MKSSYTSATKIFLVVLCASIVGIGPAGAQSGGRLVVLRAANFGWNLALNLKIDGRTAANLVQGRRYDHFLPAGRHVDRLASAKLFFFPADGDRAKRGARANIRIHSGMAEFGSCCSRSISPASGPGVLSRRQTGKRT